MIAAESVVVVRKFDGDTQLPLERVKHVEVFLALAGRGAANLLLQHSDFAHGLVDVRDLGADHVRRIVLGIPLLRTAEAVVSHVPVLPR